MREKSKDHGSEFDPHKMTEDLNHAANKWEFWGYQIISGECELQSAFRTTVKNKDKLKSLQEVL